MLKNSVNGTEEQYRSDLQDRAERQHYLESVIIRDLIICTFAVIIFSCAAYFLNLLEILADWSGRPELKEVDTLIVVIIYTVWISGIFVLRRLYELKNVLNEQRRLMEQLNNVGKRETVENMAAGLAHDFNNVIAIISALTELSMSRDEAKGQICENLYGIKKATGKAVKLVDQLMVISSGKSRPCGDLQLNWRITDMKPLLSGLARGKIDIITNLDPELGRITADEDQIDEIIINLFKNSMEAIEQKGANTGTIKISTSRVFVDDPAICKRLDMTSGEYVVLSISDNGIGIDSATLSRIFEPYFTTKTEGTGLGLAMVMSIVAKNQGRVDVESDIRNGTTFKIYFPSEKKTAGTGMSAGKHPVNTVLFPVPRANSVN